jgi:hypothetical protein
MTYEEVSSILINGTEYKSGCIYSCICTYIVEKLYPVHDPETGKHIKDHHWNSFTYNRQLNGNCQIHGSSKAEV